MTLTGSQEVALAHLRSAYLGPEDGDFEIATNWPSQQYAVGMLFPVESTPPIEAGQGVDPGTDADVPWGDLEEDAAAPPLAEDWRPSSVAVSFVTDTAAVRCDFSAGTYRSVESDGPPRWQRTPVAYEGLELSSSRPPHPLLAGGVPIQIGSRWRTYGDNYLVTVHARVLAESTGDDRSDIPLMLFQAALAVVPADDGRILEYDTTRRFDLDDESAELRLRYRNRKIFAVGHGMAADWEITEGMCTKVFVSSIPVFVVPSVETTAFANGTQEAGALRLDLLAQIDSNSGEVLGALDAFVRAFAVWVAEQKDQAAEFDEDSDTAQRIVDRSEVALARMAGGVDLLRDEDQTNLRQAFALAMSSMRLQMRQAAIKDGRSPQKLAEPQWRPFQLGFLLVAIASTVDDTHADRDLTDLIWFPTGGGKTEAYLGFAAIEIFRRRLVHGASGGGTAVITRYTLRLLTSQQFQRAASLVCAMELLRRQDCLADHRARRMAPFSIGLWVGNEVTPGTRREARDALDRLQKAARPEEANRFQVESCPWCGANLVPGARSDDPNKYGMRISGNDVIIHCTDHECAFHDELPVVVVDEVLYQEPPTVLLATVDKFARLQFRPDAGALLGLTTPFRQPSLIIQDELHLLSGPLGTTVAVFDAVIQQLLARDGSRPKIIASTATIRSSGDQVRGLYGREVALYPPAGLDDDRTFFSRPVESGVGRMYVGLMPQSLSQVSAVISATAPLIELPAALARSDNQVSRDAYWTAVLYHNSLRELGRTGTLVNDDVNGRLEPRAERLGLVMRKVRPDRVLELTSRRGPEELPRDLRELAVKIDESPQAVDIVLSSNMLSVGIDIPRLALMLMVGQPKTTAEYIQATSRVGRGLSNGIVTTLFRSNRARDRSHFESFRSYHETLYRNVEPTSVTPWSLSSRERSLAGALVTLLRHSIPSVASNDAAAQLDLDDARMISVIDSLVTTLSELVGRSDPQERDETQESLRALLRDWDRRAGIARAAGTPLLYDGKADADTLLKRFGQSGEGWLVADSMRSVEPNVTVEVQEPLEEGHYAANPA